LNVRVLRRVVVFRVVVDVGFGVVVGDGVVAVVDGVVGEGPVGDDGITPVGVVVVTAVVVVATPVVYVLVVGQVPAGFSDRLVGVADSLTDVVGPMPTVTVASPCPRWPSIPMSMYSCLPRCRPASSNARKWFPVVMVPAVRMVRRMDQYCSKSVLSPWMEGALVRFFSQIS